MSEGEGFSIEQSEELLANLKSGAPSEFEQLRSTLNLLAHVPELSPVALPPVLPSSIEHPVLLLPKKSAKSRRTIITSIIVAGMFASASLAAAAVTGHGPAPIVSALHQSTKFVQRVAGAVSNAVTGNHSNSSDEQPSAPQLPSSPSSPTANDEGDNQSEDQSNASLPLTPAPVTSPPSEKKSNEDSKKESKTNESKTSKPSQDSNAEHAQSESGKQSSSIQTPDTIAPTPSQPDDSNSD